MDHPQYILIAGVNGAGKSSLYHLQPNIVASTNRINADEILRRNHDDWRSPMANFHAMREELEIIKTSITQRLSIHVETTLSGNGKTHLDLIAQAKLQNYQIILIYVTLSSLQIAMDRVARRVAQGGHGILPELIHKRYIQSLNNFPKIASQCNQVILYDNTDKMKLVYTQTNGIINYDILQDYPWLTKLNQLKPF